MNFRFCVRRRAAEKTFQEKHLQSMNQSTLAQLHDNPPPMDGFVSLLFQRPSSTDGAAFQVSRNLGGSAVFR